MNEPLSHAKVCGETGTRRKSVRFDNDTIKELDALLIKPLPSPENKVQQEPVTAKQQSPPDSDIPQEPRESTPKHEQTPDRRERNDMEAPSGPIGIDIGTTNIVIAQNNSKSVKTFRQLNAFYTVPYAKMIKKTLSREGVNFFEKNRQLYVFGTAAQEFATMNGAQIRKPIEGGLLNPKEDDAIDVIKAIINTVIGKAPKSNIPVCFSVPGEPINGSVSTVFHESVIRMHLQSLGYSPIPINEALSIVLAELADTNFTGIGISIGGGMCNVCFSYLSVPVITYSIQKGGDYIDEMVGNAVGVATSKIKAVKENGFDLSSEPGTKIETGLHIFYDDLFTNLAQSIEQVIGISEKIPKIGTAVPVVLGGGSVAPKGCREKFVKALKSIALPFRISEVRIAEHPLYATARGSLKMAIEEATA